MTTAPPIISVIILNYNGCLWLERCLATLRQQTILDQTEIIIADNQSSDGSDDLAQKLLGSFPNGRLIHNGGNLGYCEGNNLPARAARGEFLFFLNNDTWLEPDCLEKLLQEVRRMKAAAAGPLVCNYANDSFQSSGALGFDIFGLPSTRQPHASTRDILMPEGCAYLIRREVFHWLGGFDAKFFMYADEWDLSWRLWIAGYRAITVPAARLHHRGAVAANPQGGGKIVEFRTNAFTRYHTNRNSLLVLMKCGQHVLLLLCLGQFGLLVLEAVVALVLTRNWHFVRHGYWDALVDCWKMREHILAERRRLKSLRQRGDWWMLRFLQMRLNRWGELLRVRRIGLPKVTSR